MRQEELGEAGIQQAFSYHAAIDWYSLPVEIRNVCQIKTFKTILKKHLAI
jgi:hypothetical protein